MGKLFCSYRDFGDRGKFVYSVGPGAQGPSEGGPPEPAKPRLTPEETEAAMKESDLSYTGPGTKVVGAAERVLQGAEQIDLPTALRPGECEVTGNYVRFRTAISPEKAKSLKSSKDWKVQGQFNRGDRLTVLPDPNDPAKPRIIPAPLFGDDSKFVLVKDRRGREGMVSIRYISPLYERAVEAEKPEIPIERVDVTAERDFREIVDYRLKQMFPGQKVADLPKYREWDDQFQALRKDAARGKLSTPLVDAAAALYERVMGESYYQAKVERNLDIARQTGIARTEFEVPKDAPRDAEMALDLALDNLGREIAQYYKVDYKDVDQLKGMFAITYVPSGWGNKGSTVTFVYPQGSLVFKDSSGKTRGGEKRVRDPKLVAVRDQYRREYMVKLDEQRFAAFVERGGLPDAESVGYEPKGVDARAGQASAVRPSEAVPSQDFKFKVEEGSDGKLQYEYAKDLVKAYYGVDNLDVVGQILKNSGCKDRAFMQLRPGDTIKLPPEITVDGVKFERRSV